MDFSYLELFFGVCLLILIFTCTQQLELRGQFFKRVNKRRNEVVENT